MTHQLPVPAQESQRKKRRFIRERHTQPFTAQRLQFFAAAQQRIHPVGLPKTAWDLNAHHRHGGVVGRAVEAAEFRHDLDTLTRHGRGGAR